MEVNSLLNVASITIRLLLSGTCMPAVQSTAAQQQGSPDSFPKRTPHDSGAIQPKGTEELQGNLQAALARTMTRSIALYFSRPVRLFRPTKGTQIV